MQSLFDSPYGPWLELAVPLVVGPLAVVVLAALAARWCRWAVWQRTAWQVAVLAVVVLLAAELTGAGLALVRLCRDVPSPPGVADAGQTVAPVVDAPAVPLPSGRASGFDSNGEWGDGEEIADFRVPSTEYRVLGTEPASSATDPSPRSQAPAWERTFRKLRFRSTDTDPRPRDAGTRELALEATAAPGSQAGAWEPGERRHDTGPSSPERQSRPGWGGRWWLGAVWLLGIAVVGGRILRAGVLLAVFGRRHARRSGPVLTERVGRIAGAMGLRRPVRLLDVATLQTPAVFGILRPTLVLPADFASHFDGPEQDAMLAHELAHLAAGDPAWKLASDVPCALLWWHPAAWWLRRRLWSASEAAADEACLLVPGGPQLLAACLVTLGRRLAPPRRLGWMPVTGSGFRSSLGRRVQRLLNLPARSWQRPRGAGLLAARTALPLLLALVAVFCTAWARPRANPREGESTMNVVTSSWRRSLAALAVAALLVPISGDAVAGGPAPDGRATAVHGDQPLPSGDQLALLDGDQPGPKKDGDRKEAKEGDRPDRKREAGDRGKRKDRPRGDREGGDRAERRDRPRGDREGGERAERRDRPRGERDELAAQVRELMGRREAILGKLRALKPDQDEAARDLKAQLREIEGKLRELEPRMARKQGERRPDQPNRERLQRRLEELKRASHEAAEAGQVDKAAQLAREAREINRALEGGDRPRPEGPDREQIERRMQHLRAAADNLREAGFPDQAERLLREAEQRLRGPREGGPRPEEARPRPDRPEPAVEQLREEVRQLRREMEEMRNHLRELVERERKEQR